MLFNSVESNQFKTDSYSQGGSSSVQKVLSEKKTEKTKPVTPKSETPKIPKPETPKTQKLEKSKTPKPKPEIRANKKKLKTPRQDFG